MIPADLLEILACPACRQGLAVQDDTLQCVACGRIYPVRDGIPILLVDQATLVDRPTLAPTSVPEKP